MMIYNVTELILQQALDDTNTVFDGNILFKRIERKGRTREGGEKWAVTLTVAHTWRKVPNPGGSDARPALVKVTAPGVRRSSVWGSRPSKRIAAACWHVHGTFFDALSEYVHVDDGTACDVWPCQYLKDRAEVRIVTGRLTTHPGDQWNDFNIGSRVAPLYLSEACDCEDVEPTNGRRDVGERNPNVFATVV